MSQNFCIANTKFLNPFWEILTWYNISIQNWKIQSIVMSNEDISLPEKVIDGKWLMVLPAFTNSHFHLWETVYSGIANLRSLKDYIESTEKLSLSISDGDYEIVSQYSIILQIQHGISTISAARNWKTVDDFWIRGNLWYPLMKSSKLSKYYDKSLIEKTIENLLNQYTPHSKIKIWIWTHSLNYVDAKMLWVIGDIVHKYGLYHTIHVSETKEQFKEIYNKFKKTEIEVLDSYNLLNEKTNLIHCNYVTENDLKIIEKRNANITICPLSNFYLNNELCTKRYLNYDINLSIWTDGLATWISSSLIENLRFFLLSNKHIEFTHPLDFITKNPSKTLGFEAIGSIAEWMDADILVIQDTQWFSSEQEIIYSWEPTIKYLFSKWEVLLGDSCIHKSKYHSITSAFFALQNKMKLFCS